MSYVLYNFLSVLWSSFDTSPFERHTFWTLVIGGFVTSMTIYGSNQAMIQRYLSMQSCRSAQA